jgi:hypothetical protein
LALRISGIIIILRIYRMNSDETYLFHQTPAPLAVELVGQLPIVPTDVLYEPFRGEGAFYNAFPTENPKGWSEIREQRDYKDYTGEYDWVITNPPFRLDEGEKRVNAFWKLLDYYTDRAKKGVAFLANDSCLGTLTPKRVAHLAEKGWGIHHITVCSVKKWRGRYFFIVLKKAPSPFYSCLTANY